MSFLMSKFLLCDCSPKLMMKLPVSAVRRLYSVTCNTEVHTQPRRLYSVISNTEVHTQPRRLYSVTSNTEVHTQSRRLYSVTSSSVAKSKSHPNTEVYTQPPPTELEDHKEIVDPLKHHDFFGVRDIFTLEDLFRANVHLGHKRGLRHPHMRPFVLGSRLDVDVIDLTQTVTLLGDSLNFLAHIAYRRGVILFLSRHKQMATLVERTAQDCGEYAHCRYWRGGTFTNSTIQYGAVVRHPDACVFVTTESQGFFQHVAVTESAKMNIPSVGVVDTSCDPRLITYPIPGNDDTPAAIELYCRLFKEAVLRGKAKYNETAGGNPPGS